MAVLIASGLRKELGGTTLFEGVALTLDRRDRLALAGPNGAGKTTLLRALAGQTELAAGDVVLEKGARMALHDQRPPRADGRTLREYVLSGASDLLSLEAELRQLEEAMAGGDHGDDTLRRYAEAQARLEHGGGWAWRDRIGSTLRGLGFSEDDLDRGLATFSGGELTRASLGRVLAGDPDVLLLDEPTNHLDLESLEWLERRLAEIDAAVILVAHDRWFLEATTTAVLELVDGRSTYFPGSWHDYRREQAARRAAQERAAERQADELARLDRFVSRFRYGTKARQAQSKLKRIERIEQERVLPPAAERRTLGFDFLRPKRSGDTVVELRDLTVTAGERTLLAGATAAIERGEHVALVGPNGAGKTTLVETLLGRRPATGGSCRLGYGVEVAYFSQHDAELDRPGTILDATIAATGLNRPQAQNLLGRFLFSGWEVHEKQVSALSGGERRRLALAHVVASGANFLVLDEPTNHLDLESREALEAALEAFPATVLLVSHDRALLDAVAGRILALEDGTLRSYPGGWADYVVRREQEAAPPPVAKASPKQAPPPEAPPARRPEGGARAARKALEKAESEVTRLEAEVASLEQRLSHDWADTELAGRYRRAKDDLEAALARWEELFAAAAGD
ncbi:MAG: ABC-F family ATP-binding cassette domain-containing protein [Thermoleophilia bacterium]